MLSGMSPLRYCFITLLLIASFKKMSRFHSEIYPLRWNDVMVGLNERDKTVDLIICFRPKRR